jgi:DNA/RNA endonuclease YhcR with UshA esterase domain
MMLKRLGRIGAAAVIGVAFAGTTFGGDISDYAPTEAGKHAGEKATVTGKIEDVHRAQGGSIFLNMGGKHPNEEFVAFIPAKYAEKFADVEKNDGAVVTVSGEIKMHEGKPEIVVTEASQIVVKEKKEEKKDK